MTSPTKDERLLGGLWGALTGDALGVPVEFRTRASIRENPVTGPRGFGTHHQPAGTWSDDSSLLLCSVESLAACGGLDLHDLGARFVRWEREGYWTPHGNVFDIGIATRRAIARLATGTAPELAGGADEHSNGNGSLMRILPIALWYRDAGTAVLAGHAMRASALTHRHPRSQLACAFYCLLAVKLMRGAPPVAAYAATLESFDPLFKDPAFRAERPSFELLQSGQLAGLPEREIGSNGYVMETLTASLWCLLTSTSFEETVLKAVNLGDDSDTTGCVAGGLAGLLYGVSAIPWSWKKQLARHDEVEALFEGMLARNPAASEAVTLYRPVGPQELALIAESGWRAFPPRLPEQPIFYPVLEEEYAVQIARDWNVPASGAGYVTRFHVPAACLERFPVQTVGGAVHRELWIPAEELAEFNRQLLGPIEVIAEFKSA